VAATDDLTRIPEGNRKKDWGFEKFRASARKKAVLWVVFPFSCFVTLKLLSVLTCGLVASDRLQLYSFFLSLSCGSGGFP
jgi:hypothetical protein